MQALLRLKRAYEKQSNFVKFGVPFGIFMIGGSIGLREFTALRYEFSSSKRITQEDLQKYGLKKRDERFTSPDVIYETQVKGMDTESWENIRGPRPWEDNGAYMEKMKQKARMDKEKLQKHAHQPET